MSNAILESKDWEPLNFYSPLQQEIPVLENSVDQRLFEPALPIAVEVNTPEGPKADIYIDDTTTVTVDVGDNCTRAARAVLLAIEIVGRQQNDNDPIPRHHLVSISKLIAEAALEERKVLLGWVLDTRELTVSLPEEKIIAWSSLICKVINKGTSNHDKLDTTIGRLTHVSVVIPYMKHFMSWIRQEKKRAKNRKKIRLKKEAIEDLKLHLKFLDNAKAGINMNLLT